MTRVWNHLIPRRWAAY